MDRQRATQLIQGVVTALVRAGAPATTRAATSPGPGSLAVHTQWISPGGCTPVRHL